MFNLFIMLYSIYNNCQGLLEVIATIVGSFHAVGCLFVCECLNISKLCRDGVLFIVLFAEEEDGRLVGSDDGFCFGDVYVVVNGQYVDVRLSGGV